MRFSILAIFLFTTAVAVICASLVYANAILGDLYYTLGLLTIGFAALAAIYRRGPDRAFWIGFVVLFAGYFCHTVWPSEVRTTWTAMQRIGNIGVSASDISTTRFLSWGFEFLHGVPSFGRPYIAPRARVNDVAEQYISFMTIGHTGIAMLLGLVGGFVARRFAVQAVKEKSESSYDNTKGATASPPAADSGEA